MRRRYRWGEIAALARSTPGVWRQHSDLIAVTPHLYRHIRRRVPALQPDAGGEFRYRRGVSSTDLLGRPIFDLKIKYQPKENP